MMSAPVTGPSEPASVTRVVGFQIFRVQRVVVVEVAEVVVRDQEAAAGIQVALDHGGVGRAARAAGPDDG